MRFLHCIILVSNLDLFFISFWCLKDMDKFTEIVADAYDQQYFLPKAFLAKVPLVVHKYLVRNNYKISNLLVLVLEGKRVKLNTSVLL